MQRNRIPDRVEAVAAEDNPIPKPDPNDTAEAERLGRVDFHHGKARDQCPYPEGDPNRERWQTNWDVAKGRPRRHDMPNTEEAGWRAHHDGLRKDECPYRGQAQRKAAREWQQGYEKAQKAKEKEAQRQRDRLR